MNGRKPCLSPEAANTLRRMYAEGWQVRTLARLFRIDPKTVRNYMAVRHKHPEVSINVPVTAVKQLGMARGERNANSKLTADRVRELRREATQGASYASLGRTYGLHPSSVQRITSGLLWAHVE
jgi:Helix-turn-helix domain of resolvase